MKRLKQHSVLLFALVAVLCVATVSVQAATLNVTVTDARTGEKLDGISVTAVSQAGTANESVSDAAGMLEIANLAAGVYTITASAPGYTDKTMANVELAADGTTSVEIALSSEIIELDQVSVTASRRREKVLEAPASVALVTGSQIRDRVAPSVTEHLKSVRGVDVVNTGLGSSHVVVRGFNNVFSGSLLSLVDNRIARVPSLRVNAYSLIPTASEDIEQIEVVSGPGSALYGPNSANGVMHILTRSPFTSQGTTVSIGGGERSMLLGSLRHAGVINETLGYKLSVNGFRGDDWEEGRSKADIEEGEGEPIFDTYRAGGEFRVDYKPNDDLTTILASGFTQFTGMELTSIGAGQAKNWTYGYLQGRFIYKDLFAQAFWNRSDAGDTYTLRSGNPIIDNSDLYVGQIQHGYSLGERQRFTYGVDLLLTQPDTEGTINGRNEDSDNINEIGAYLQSETKILSQLKFIAAARGDYHNHIDDLVFSPRAALAFQPTDDHNLRLTYNRAFSTPSTSNLFLDILAAKDPFQFGANFQPVLGFSPSIDIYASGAKTGFTFKRGADGRPLFRSPFSPVAELPAETHIPLDDPMFTNVMWGVGRGAVMNGVQPIFEAGVKQTIQQTFTPQALPQLVAALPPERLQGLAAQVISTLDPQVLQGLPPELAPLLQPGAIAALPPAQLQQIVPQVLQALPPQVVQGLAASLAASTEEEILSGFASLIPEQVDGVKNVLRPFNPDTRSFLEGSIDVKDVTDIDPIKPTITQTYEFGYKGILMNKLAFSADVYHTRINNFIAPFETPNVFLDAETLGAFLAQHFTAALSDPKNATLNQALLAFDEPAQGGNGDGSVVDELTKLFVAGTENNGPAFIPFGTVTPEEVADPNAIMQTYRNYDSISLNGLDCSLTYYLNPSLSFGGNYSFVSKDSFKDAAGVRDIALNAPKNKFGANIQYLNTNLGVGAGIRMNFVAGFPMYSGVYIGDVESYYTIDLSAGYDIPFGPSPRLSLTVQNLLGTEYQPFIGAPMIGRLSLIRLTQTF